MSEFYVYRSVFIATSVTWSSPILSKLEHLVDNPLGRKITFTENSLLACLLILGAGIGSILCGFAVGKFGRKTILITCGLPFFVFNLSMAWINNIWFYYVCRLYTGIGLGSVSTILPIYSAEIAQVKNRGILGASMTVFVNIGLLIPYCVGPYVSFSMFHVILAVIAAIYMLLFYFFAPESPYFSIKTDRKAARLVLEKIRDPAETDRNLDEITWDLNNKTEFSLIGILKDKGLRRAFIVGLGMVTFMQLTSTGIVATYTQTIFEEAGSDCSPEISSMIIGIAQLIATLIISIIADRFSRKLMLITSHLGVAIVEIPFGLYFYLKHNGNDVSNLSLLPLICLIVYVILYNVGVGPFVYSSLGELFPLEIKGKVVSFLIFYHWIDGFFLTLLFNKLKELIGMGVLFWFSSFTGFLAAIFIKILLVETRGKTFEQIQRELQGL